MRGTYHNEGGRKRTAALLAALCLAAVYMSAGCGGKDEEAVSGSVQTQAETGEAAQDAESGTEDVTPAMTQEEIEAAQVAMDDETRQQLTAQLLEENDLDTSVMEIERATRGCVFGVPEGFHESEETPGLYVTDRYPIDASMIYYEVMDRDVSLQLLTAELFREQAQESLSEAYGEDVTVNVESFESVEISGYPAFRILCSYEAEGLQVTQLEYAINADKTYMITYTQTDEYDRMEAYKASAATIKVR